MEIKIDSLVNGAQRAEGTAVIVDIFRSTSLIATLFGLGAKEIYPTTELEQAISKRDEISLSIKDKVYLVGECNGVTTDEFDIANTPVIAYQKYRQGELAGKTIVGSSTNGYKGILYAKNADEVITSSFLNADATVDYIRSKEPDLVTIVGMGEFGEPSDEDSMFCEFLSAKIQGKGYDDMGLRDYLKRCRTAKLMIDILGEYVQEDIDFCLDPKIDYHVVPKLKYGKIVDGYT